MSDWGRVRFRAWLLAKVLENQNLARVCCVAVHKKQVDDVAAQSGLHPSLVEDAGKEFARRVVAAGRAAPTGPRTDPHAYPQIPVVMPPEVHAAWAAYTERIHVKPAAAIRTVIHWYLLGSDEPKHRDERWVLSGKVIDSAPTKRWEPAITNGALAALETRAAKLGLTPRVLIRGLLVDVLAGRRRVGTPVQRASMFDDAKRYRL